MLVLPDHRALDHARVGFARAGAERGRGGGVGQGRDPHLLPRLQPRRRLDPAAIDPKLAGAAQLFDRDLVQLRELPPEPAVQPLIAFVRADADHLHRTHAPIPRATADPATSASSDRPTLAAT